MTKYPSHQPSDKVAVCLCVHADELEHRGLHCEALSRVSSSCSVKATRGERRQCGGGGGGRGRWKEGLGPQIRLTCWLKPGLTGTDTHSHGCSCVLTSSHTQPGRVAAVKF